MAPLVIGLAPYNGQRATPRTGRGLLPALAVTVLLSPTWVYAEPSAWSGTIYGARISTQPGWEDIIIDSIATEFVDSYLVAGALSRQYAQRYGGALTLEWESQVVYHFGDESYWEFNAVPAVVRWNRFPWSRRVATSAAFGLGISYTTELPEIEVALEGESRQCLIYWLMELTAGPVDAPWAVSLRLHHRSVAYGLMGDEGGMNAVALGLRYRF
jgi:hypothetical protein